MMFRFMLALSVALTVSSAAAAEGDEPQVDPAPSGREEAVVLTDGETSVIVPGDDAPVEVDGNKIDFTEPDPDTHPDDTTVIYEPPSSDDGASSED